MLPEILAEYNITPEQFAEYEQTGAAIPDPFDWTKREHLAALASALDTYGKRLPVLVVMVRALASRVGALEYALAEATRTGCTCVAAPGEQHADWCGGIEGK